MTNHPLLTNILLFVIAALLLVLVIQNGMNSSAPRPQFVSESSMPHSGGGHPAVNSGAGPMGQNMFFLAVRGFPDGCEGKKVLADCDSPAAQAVKAAIEAQVAEGKGPRQVFDFIVEKWGEGALTEQAQKIRSMRPKK